MSFGLIDEIIDEPSGWKVSAIDDTPNYNTFEEIALKIKKVLTDNLVYLSGIDEQQRQKLRYDKFRSMGVWI